MIFGQDRHELRKMYADAWKKQLAGQSLSPLEAQIAAVVAEHPEYHDALTGADWTGTTRPKAARRTRSCTWGCISASASRWRPTGPAV